MSILIKTKEEIAIDQVIDSIRPEIKELLEMAKQDLTTKDGYGVLVSFLSQFKDKLQAQIFLLGCIREGYPRDTANQVQQILGWR